MRKKEEFIKNSRDRMNNLKANALKRQHAVMVQESKGALRSSYMPRGKMSEGRGGSNAKRSKDKRVDWHPSVKSTRSHSASQQDAG